ncbi:MAG: hypothetical protein RMY30_002155, partial [Nostoc sp. CmiSLP01]|nr:hypothetical protein [Nostoc sp. CmiSLP01]
LNFDLLRLNFDLLRLNFDLLRLNFDLLRLNFDLLRFNVDLEINYQNPILWGGHLVRPCLRAGETPTPQEKFNFFDWESP